MSDYFYSLETLVCRTADQIGLLLIKVHTMRAVINLSDEENQ